MSTEPKAQHKIARYLAPLTLTRRVTMASGVMKKRGSSMRLPTSDVPYNKKFYGGIPMISFKNGFVILPILILIVLSGGCVMNQIQENQTMTSVQTTVAPITPQSVAVYKVTITQEDGSHADYIKMDSDVYNPGEIVEFYLINLDSEPIPCGSLSPYYMVALKSDNGSWMNIIDSGYQQPGRLSNNLGIEPGESTRTYRLDTTGWRPGLYRIVFNCGGTSQTESASGQSRSIYEQGIYRDFTIVNR
jgi:hypothetical protein